VLAVEGCARAHCGSDYFGIDVNLGGFMTTEAAAHFYLAEHLLEWEGKGYEIFNPHGKPIAELPVIYGFNNGGSADWWNGDLLAEDGHFLGGHICSNEGYMPHDLGVLKGSRPDRHEGFQKHYPDGYRMDFVPIAETKTHEGLNTAYQRHLALPKETATEGLQAEVKIEAQ
jgi:hypothetical protein